MIILQEISGDVVQSTFTLFDKLSVKFFMRLAFDLVTVFLLVRLVYLPKNRRGEKVFTFTLFNLIIFLITFLLNKVEMSLGAAFGLFAVFAMLRYRTEGISTKDMTYLFLFIALGLINAVSKGNWDELGLLNLILLLATWVMDSSIIFRRQSSKLIIYEKIELITPERRKELMEDIEKRLGIKPTHIEIERINLLRDTARIHVFYYE